MSVRSPLLTDCIGFLLSFFLSTLGSNDARHYRFEVNWNWTAAIIRVMRQAKLHLLLYWNLGLEEARVVDHIRSLVKGAPHPRPPMDDGV